MTDLWTAASHDAEAEEMSRRVTAARVSAVDVWPFLAGAETKADFENRKAIVADRLDHIVSALLPSDPVAFSVVRASLEASLDEDYSVIAEARAAEAQVRARVEAGLRQRSAEEAARQRVEANLQRAAAEQCPGSGSPMVDQGERSTDAKFFGKALGKCPVCKKQVSSKTNKTPNHTAEKTSAKVAASDTGTCGTCGRATSYDKDSRKWSHDNEGSDTDHPVTKAAAKTGGLSDLDDAALDKELRSTMERQNNSRDKGIQDSLRNFRKQIEDEQKRRKGGDSGGSGGGQGRDDDGKFAAKTATRYCPTHKVYVGDGNQENHDHCPVETRKKKSSKTAAESDRGVAATCPVCYRENVAVRNGKMVAHNDPTREGNPRCEGTGKEASLKTAAFPQKDPATDAAPEQEAAPESTGKVERRVDPDPATGEFVGSEWVEKEGDPNTLVQSDSTFGKNPRFKTEEEGQAWTAETASEEPAEEEEAEVEDTTKPDAGKSNVPEQFEKKNTASKTASTEGPWKAQVAGIGEMVWSENALRFDTEEEARAHIADLSMRWFGFDLGRVVPADTPNREPVDLSDPKITHNFRTGSRKQAAKEECPDCGGTGSVPASGGEPEDEVDNGYKQCPTCGGSGEVHRRGIDDAQASKTSGSRHPFGERTAARPIVNDSGGKSYVAEREGGIERRYYSDGSVTVLDTRKKSGTNRVILHTGPNPDRIQPEFQTSASHRHQATNPYSPSGNPYVAPMQTPGTPDDVLDGPADPNPPVLQMPMTTRPRQMPAGGDHNPEPGIDKPESAPPSTGRTV